MASKLKLQDRTKRRDRRKYKIRKTVQGTAERPRLVVFRSNKGVYAQIVDDSKGFTVAAASSRGVGTSGKKSDLAKQAGMLIAEKAKEKGIKAVVFDRNGYLYHGRVKALAEGAREGGLAF
ncbi:MAG TPA: 50S ribosomal protein L18 [Candidatus Kapabacteria bacterium]|jgi:large subunit ribosomal protein L18|nr:50S ribosomal protein L18 [Candidatus Kapabacteria bacterium]